MDKEEYLECEKSWVYILLITAAGWFGAYTFVLRGGVFCNAQTANVVLFAIAIGQFDFSRAAYLAIPISAYFLGAFASEYLGKTVKKLRFLRWDTLLVGIEILVIIVLGALPAKTPDQISQISLNFICSMQFNTFRQMQGTPAATTFVTNHIRQIGSNLAKYIRHHDEKIGTNLKRYAVLFISFLLGALISTVLAGIFSYKSIWGSAVILLAIFIGLAHADLTYEKEKIDKVPHGH